MPASSRVGTVASARHGAAEIAESLIGQIRDGTLEIGTSLPPERALVETFGASRPTVREALALMQHRGYLDGGGGRRPRVVRPSLGSILASAAAHIRETLADAEIGAHVEQLRQFIETGAAREAALKAAPLHLAEIRIALDRNRDAVGTDGFAGSDIAFHRAIVAVVANPILLQLHDMFVTTMLASRAPTDDPARYDRIAHDEHRAIFEAIVDRDPSTATDVMERHLARSYRARLGARPAATDG